MFTMTATDLRSLCVKDDTLLFAVASNVRKALKESPGCGGFQDPQRKPTHVTLIDPEEVKSLMAMYGDSLPTTKDEWATFTRPEYVTPLLVARANAFSTKGWTVTFGSNHVELTFPPTARCPHPTHTTLAWWKDGVPAGKQDVIRAVVECEASIL